MWVGAEKVHEGDRAVLEELRMDKEPDIISGVAATAMVVGGASSVAVAGVGCVNEEGKKGRVWIGQGDLKHVFRDRDRVKKKGRVL